MRTYKTHLIHECSREVKMISCGRFVHDKICNVTIGMVSWGGHWSFLHARKQYLVRNDVTLHGRGDGVPPLNNSPTSRHCGRSYLSQPAWNRYGLGLNWYYELSFNILLKGIVICRQFVRDFWNIFRFLLFCLSLTGRQSHASNSTRSCCSCLLLSVLCFSFLLSTLPSLTACVPLSPSLPTLSFLLDVAWALIWV